MPQVKSRIWTISDEELQSIINKSECYSDVLKFLGYQATTGHSRVILIKRIKDSNLNDESIRDGQRLAQGTFKKSTDDFFVIGKEKPGYKLKNRLFAEGLIEEKCSNPKCNITTDWLGNPLVLHIDHINGNRKDNRLENLRLLCPNCHSQTDTYCSKNRKKKRRIQKFCLTCNKEIENRSTYCIYCYIPIKFTQSNPRKFEVTKEQLEELLKINTMTALGKMFGVSDNSVKKRAIKLGIVLGDRRKTINGR